MTDERRITTATDLSDWDDEALASLIDDECDRWIDIQCAKRGIALLPPDPGPAPKEPLSEPDLTIYEVSVGYSTIATYTTPEAAESVREALAKATPFVAVMERHDYNSTKYLDHAGAESKVKVEESAVLSRHAWEKIKDDAIEYARVRARWQTARDEYETVLKARASVVDELRSMVDEATEAIEERRKAEEIFDRYLDLADNDRETALRFMSQAHPAYLVALGYEEEAKKALDNDEYRAAVRRFRRSAGRALAAVAAEDAEEEEA